MESDTRDRVIRLEMKTDNIKEDVEDMKKKVDQVHELLMQAKGARWVVFLMAAVGSFVASKMTIWSGWFSGLPK